MPQQRKRKAQDQGTRSSKETKLMQGNNVSELDFNKTTVRDLKVKIHQMLNTDHKVNTLHLC